MAHWELTPLNIIHYTELYLVSIFLLLVIYGTIISRSKGYPLLERNMIFLCKLLLLLGLLIMLNYETFLSISKNALEFVNYLFNYSSIYEKNQLYGLTIQNETVNARPFFITDDLYFLKRSITKCLFFLNGGWSGVFNSNLDYLSFLFKILILLASFVSFLLIQSIVSVLRINYFEYSLIIILSIVGSLTLCSAHNLLTIYISLELQSLSLYVLAAFKKKSFQSIESGLKYFVLGAFSSGFFLLGSTFLYCLLGTVDLQQLKLLIDSSNVNDSNIAIEEHNVIELAVMLIFGSLFFKLAVAPFHSWSPDVYEGSPISTSLFFSAVSKLSIFVLLFKLYFFYFSSTAPFWTNAITYFGLLSILIGCLGGLEQRKIKSLLTYSTISHTGFIIVSFASCSYFSTQMAVSYILIYVVSSLAIWSIFIFLRTKDPLSYMKKHNKNLNDFSLLKKSNIMMASCLSIFLFSMSGMPPLLGFLGKLNIFLGLFETGNITTALVSIFLSVLSTFFYIRFIKVFFFENALVGRLYFPILENNSVLLILFAVLLMFLFWDPISVYFISQKAIFPYSSMFF